MQLVVKPLKAYPCLRRSGPERALDFGILQLEGTVRHSKLEKGGALKIKNIMLRPEGVLEQGGIFLLQPGP